MQRKILAAALFALLASAPSYAQTPVLNPVTPLTGTAGPNGSATPVSPTNPLPISGSFSATLSGFTPNGLYASLTATASSSASTAIPTGSTTVRITNLGTGTVSCTFATGAATGLVNNTQVGPSSSVSRAVGAFDHLACIDQTGSSGSQLVIIEGGAGLGNDTGGGGGGSGGAVTLASGAVASGAYSAGSYAAGALAAGAFASGAGVDGWDLTQGAKADSAYAGSGSASVVSLLKGIYAGIAGSIPAGTNLIGKVGIDQTTPGTTNGVQLPTATNGGAPTVKGGVAVVSGGSFYQAVAASATATVLQSSTGAVGDYLSHCVLYPTSTSPGVVTVFDNTNAAATDAILFPGGASSLSNLAPISIPVGAYSVSGAWKVTTGTAISVVCYGKFS